MPLLRSSDRDSLSHKHFASNEAKNTEGELLLPNAYRAWE